MECHKVLDIVELVSEILERVGCTRSVHRSTLVKKSFLAAVRSDTFCKAYADRNRPACLGFLVEVRNSLDVKFSVISTSDVAVSDTGAALSAWIQSSVVRVDNLIGFSGGIMLFLGVGSPEIAAGYYSIRPGNPVKVHLSPRIPRIPHVPGMFCLGQFGVIRDAGSSGIAFYVQEAEDCLFRTSYHGLSLHSSGYLYVHVCTFNDGRWDRHISSPISPPLIQSSSSFVFHQDPHCVLVGEQLYMMYVVGIIVCFDLTTSCFSVITLPGEISDKINSWYDYSVGEHRSGSIALVHFRSGKLTTWVLHRVISGDIWTCETELDLQVAFTGKFDHKIWHYMSIWELVISAFPLNSGFVLSSDQCYSVQVRSISVDARFVYITLGFHPGLFVADMVKRTIYEVGNVRRDRGSRLGRVFPLSEPWPPKF